MMIRPTVPMLSKGGLIIYLKLSRNKELWFLHFFLSSPIILFNFDFIQRAGINKKVEVIWIRPSMMIGPGDINYRSIKIIVSFLHQSTPIIPNGKISVVDVRGLFFFSILFFSFYQFFELILQMLLLHLFRRWKGGDPTEDIYWLL